MPDIWCDVDAAVTLPANIFPLTDDTDFKSREITVAYNEAGMDLVWNFQTPAGVQTQTAVTPTTAGDYDWAHVGDGMYKIEMTASGGASANNDTEGFGWFSGVATGVLPWRGPIIGFRAAALNNTFVEGTDISVGGGSEESFTVDKDSTDVSTYVTLYNDDGTEATGYTLTNLDLTYVRDGTAVAAKVNATSGSATAHSDNTVTECDATNMPGEHKVDWPDAPFATGVDQVTLYVKGAGLKPKKIHIDLVDTVTVDSSGRVDVGKVAGTTQTANDNGADINAILVDTGTTIPALIGTPVGADISADIAGVQTDTTAIVADTNELQGDWVNGGRLDLIMDIIAADTTTDIPALIATAQNDLNTITGASGVIIAANTITAATIATGALTAAAFAADALVAATFATDSITADALAADAIAEIKAAADQSLTDIKLDHLMAVLAADSDIVDGSALAQMASKTNSFVDFDYNTDSLQAIKDTAAAGGDATAANQTTIINYVDTLETLIGNLEDLSAAQVTTEVEAALGTTTRTLPGVGAPTATPTFTYMVGLLYKALRNKSTQSTTEYTLYDDTGLIAHQKATLSEAASVVTKEEMGTGAP